MAVNGKQYSYENIAVSMMGKVVAGCVAIEYDETAESTEIHVLGSSEPYAVIDGKRTYKGKITITVDELDALQDSIEKGKSVTQLAAFEIVVTRLGANDVLRTDVCKKVRFTQISKKNEAGQPFDRIELPFTAAKIEYNV
jgi:hypothetical protein